MKIIACVLMLSALLYSQAAEGQDGTTDSVDIAAMFDSLGISYDSLVQAQDSIASSFTYQSGAIELGDGIARLQVPDGFKYLDPQQSKTVLEDIWGNLPSETLGMLFPAEYGPLDDETWAIEISFSKEGYVDDSDAADIDYDDLLEQMQESTEKANAVREQMGYEPVTLIGWATAPHYDTQSKKLYWAKEAQFGSSETNSLNYNIRALGRRGVLVLNAIGTMDQLPVIEQRIQPVIGSVNFTEGNTYADFDPEIDHVAAYGVGGLIAGKVLAKTGFFALLAKGWKLILVGLIAVGAIIRKFFFGRSSEEQDSPQTSGSA